MTQRIGRESISGGRKEYESDSTTDDQREQLSKISRALNRQARGKAVISLSAGGLFMNEKSFGR